MPRAARHGGTRSCIEDIIVRKTPEGHYVVPARREARRVVEELGAEFVEMGERILVLVKSRREAKRIASKLASLGLLYC